MSKTRRWNVEKAVACITRNGGKIGGKAIGFTRPGIKVLGAIDFLVNYHEYYWNRTV